jgi:PTS system mannose-specific IIC component
LNFLEALPIGLLGALLGLDVVSFPQAMISRPIVASTAAGSFIGNPPAGLLIGVVLEMIALDTLPFGASRYPEWGSAGVVGGALFAAQPSGMPGALPAALLAALLTASISGWSMVLLRRIIATRLERSRDRIEEGSRNALFSLHLEGMTLDLLRGAIVTTIAMVIFSPIVRAIVAIQAAGAQRNPQLARGAFIYFRNRTVADAVGARRVVTMMAKLRAAFAQLVESRIDGADP